MFITIVNRFDKFFIKFTKQGKITGMLIPKILRIIFDFSSLQYTQYPVSILFKQVFPVSYCILLILILRTHLMSHFSLKIRIQGKKMVHSRKFKRSGIKSGSICVCFLYFRIKSERGRNVWAIIFFFHFVSWFFFNPKYVTCCL